MNVACPFCKHDDTSLRREGCCFCDYSGAIPSEDYIRLLDFNAPNDEQPYPFFSDHDLKAGREILKDNKAVNK